MLSKKKIEEIRQYNDIADVIGSYINLKKSGFSSFKALCPFHKEKTASFHVNTERQMFHCFGCGVGGDVFKFLMLYEGLDFFGAAQMLAQKAGISIEFHETDAEKTDKNALYKLHEDLSLFYSRCIEKAKSAAYAREYLKKRKLAVEEAKPFRIGYAPPGEKTLLKWAAVNKLDPALLEKAGLILKSNNTANSEFYDRFRNRLMFPIFDEQGRVIAFSGRALEEGANTAKYVNSPETSLFKKSRVLYALHIARKYIVDSREAIVCEGQIDVIRLHLAGFKNAIASQGTAFTEEHARLLKRYTDSVIIVFDPDKAGEDAAIRTAGIFIESGLSVRVAELPQGYDPDSFIINNGAEAFASIIKSAKSAVGFQISVLGRRENIKNEAGMRKVVKNVFATIAKTPDQIQRDALLLELGNAFPSLKISSLFQEFTLYRSKPQPEPADSGKQSTDESVPREEEELCRHLVHIGEEHEIAETVRNFLPLDLLSNHLARAVAQKALKAQEKNVPINEVIYEDGVPSDEIQRFAAKIIMDPPMTGGIRINKTSRRSPEFSKLDQVRGLILYFWKRKLEKERKRLQDIMRERELTGEEAQQRLQLSYDIRSLRNWETGSPTITVMLNK